MRFIKKYLGKLRRFYIYGKVGMNCYAWEASYIDQLINVHLKEVLKFMESEKTYALWASKDKGLKRKLKELIELSNRKCKNEFKDLYNFGKLSRKYPRKFIKEGEFYTLTRDTVKIRKIKMIAIKKDDMSTRHLEKRYNLLLTKYIPMFWD